MIGTTALATAILKGVKSLTSRLTLKHILYGLGTIIVIYGLWSGYNWIYERGASSRDQEVADLTTERNQLRADFKQWKQDTADAEKKWKADQKLIQDDLKQQLATANEKANNREVIYRDVVKYISVADDAACVIPVNFGLLHNFSIEGTPPGAADLLSDSPGRLQGAPSTLTLSQYSEVTGFNNSEAVRRGEIIHQWEEWYDRSYQGFTEAQRSANQAIPRLDQTPKP